MLLIYFNIKFDSYSFDLYFDLLVFQFHPSILSWLRIEFHNYFHLLFMRLSQFHDMSHGNAGLLRFFSFLLNDFFLISFFYIELFMN